LKDWTINTGHDGGSRYQVLWHRCKAMYATGNHVQHWCSRDDDGWFCGLCETVAPEEIDFCADLAGCESLHSIRAIRTDPMLQRQIK